MGSVFNTVMKVVSTLIGVLMVCMGGVWFLQGTGVAFQVGFMAGDPQWAIYGALLAIIGVCQAIWSVTRRN
jgi:hypothetical protein